MNMLVSILFKKLITFFLGNMGMGHLFAKKQNVGSISGNPSITATVESVMFMI